MSHQQNDDAEESASSSRRIWKRRNGAADGSSELALAAMAVLYDASEPLTRDQIAERLWPRLDDYARAYLQAWDARRRQLVAQAVRRSRGHRDNAAVNLHPNKRRFTTVDAHLRLWLTQVFAQRAAKGQSLIRLPDGRYQPGPRAPVAQTLDGTRLRYTPEARHAIEQADQQQGRLHLIQLEFKRAAATLSDQSAAARAEALRFLLRRLYPRDAVPNVSRVLGHTFGHLLKVADTPEFQQAVVRLATEWLLT